MPRSNSQTSPRRGSTLLLVQECDKGSPCLSDFLVGKRTGVERNLSCAPQYLNGKGLPITGRQRLKGLE